MRCYSLVSIALLTVAIVVPSSIVIPVAAQTPVTQFSVSRMGLGGIKLGTKAAQVQRKLGKPQKFSAENSSCCGKLLAWQYPELEVRLEVPENGDELKASVYSISTRSSKFVTLEGIRVGDRRSKVMQVYGVPADSEPDAIYYSNDKYASRLVFRLKNDRVVEIIAATQLN